MVSTAYSTGSWLGIVRSGSVIVLEAHTDPQIVHELWDFLGASPSIKEVLNKVTAQFGASLTDVPDFAILVQRTRLHAVLRGDLNLVVQSGGYAEEMTGLDVITWSERSLPLPESLMLTMPQSANTADEWTFLPVVEAVVLLERLYMGPIDEKNPDTQDQAHPAIGVYDSAAAAIALGPAEVSDSQGIDRHFEVLDETADEQDQADYQEQYAETDSEFALAANAEWTAQLAPVVAVEDEPDVAEASLEEKTVQVLPPRPSQPPLVGPSAEHDDPAEEAGDAEEYLSPTEDANDVEASAPKAAPDLTEDESEELSPPDSMAQELNEEPQPSSIQIPATGSEPDSEPAFEKTQGSDAAPEVESELDTGTATGLAPEDEGCPRGEFDQGTHPDLVVSHPIAGPIVVARMCRNGHANPAYRSACWDCGEVVEGQPCEVARPRLGAMHLSDGDVVELDESLIVGRAPDLDAGQGSTAPRLVQVASKHGDISRSHVEVRLVGWDVLLVDLQATNGTVLVREGQPPRRIDPGEEILVLNGDVAELGDGVSLFFDGLR